MFYRIWWIKWKSWYLNQNLSKKETVYGSFTKFNKSNKKGTVYGSFFRVFTNQLIINSLTKWPFKLSWFKKPSSQTTFTKFIIN